MGAGRQSSGWVSARLQEVIVVGLPEMRQWSRRKEDHEETRMNLASLLLINNVLNAATTSPEVARTSTHSFSNHPSIKNQSGSIKLSHKSLVTSIYGSLTGAEIL